MSQPDVASLQESLEQVRSWHEGERMLSARWQRYASRLLAQRRALQKWMDRHATHDPMCGGPKLRGDGRCLCGLSDLLAEKEPTP